VKEKTPVGEDDGVRSCDSQADGVLHTTVAGIGRVWSGPGKPCHAEAQTMYFMGIPGYARNSI